MLSFNVIKTKWVIKELTFHLFPPSAASEENNNRFMFYSKCFSLYFDCWAQVFDTSESTHTPYAEAGVKGQHTTTQPRVQFSIWMLLNTWERDREGQKQFQYSIMHSQWSNMLFQCAWRDSGALEVLMIVLDFLYWAYIYCHSTSRMKSPLQIKLWFHQFCSAPWRISDIPKAHCYPKCFILTFVLEL